jgi:hypothetical protein
VSFYDRFDPPAYLADFARVPGLSDEWSKAMSSWFDSTLDHETKTFRDHGVEPMVQYFNPLKAEPKGPTLAQAITWNAFPKELLRRMSRDQALLEGDRLHPLIDYSPNWKPDEAAVILYNRIPSRPHNEY